MQRAILTVLMASSGFLAAGCGGGGVPTVGVGVGTGVILSEALLHRPRITEAEEVAIARSQAVKFEKENKMWEDLLLETYLTKILQRLVPHARSRPFAYRIRIVRDPSLNAFTFGGGLIYAHIGLLARMDSEAQLAGIVAHEMAHSTERHIPRGIEAKYNTKLLGAIMKGAGGGTGALPGPALDAVYEYSMLAMINGHGRKMETEADNICIDIMVKAGYDPHEVPAAFQKLLELYGDPPREINFFYSSHPTNVARYKYTTELIETKYAKQIEGKKLLVNTEEYKRRTRKVVVLAGKLDYETKRFGTAVAMFEKALKVKEDDPVCHYYLGKIALEVGADEGAVDRAITCLNKATEFDSKYAPPYRELGLAYYRKGDEKKAIEYFEKYLKLAPNARDAKSVRTSIEDLKQQ